MLDLEHERLRALWAAKREAVRKAQQKLDTEQSELESLEEDVRQQERVCERAAYRLEQAQDSLEQMERELRLAGIPIPSDPPPRCSETQDMFGGGG